MKVRLTRENQLRPGDIVCWTDPRKASDWRYEAVMVVAALPSVYYGLTLDSCAFLDFPLGSFEGISCYVIELTEES